MAETSRDRLLSFRQLTTTPYHTLCIGLVKGFSRTLKKWWDDFVQRALRTVTWICGAIFLSWHHSRNSRIFNFWIGWRSHSQRFYVDFLWATDKRGIGSWNLNNLSVCFRFKNRLQSTFQLAKDNPERSVTYCNERAGQRDMKKDEKVFDLFPTSNKLLIRVERTLQNSLEGRTCRL